MTTLKKQINLGGNVALFVIPSTLIHSILSETILYVGTNPTYEIECAAESIQHICKLSETRAGDLYTHTISAFLPGYNKDTLEMLTRLRQYNSVVVVLRNGLGEYYHIGDNREGLRLAFDFDSSKDPSGKNGFAIEISGPLTFSFKPVQMPAIPL
jgi:hypothetical protein